MIEVRLAADSSEVDEALELRRRVFVGQQGVTLEADRDGLDPEATQIVALDGGRVVGTCRLVLDEGLARLGRMAVDDDWRGRGLGGALLREAEAQARGRGATRIRLHAQLAAHSLYERGGFEVKGEQFMEEGIPHLTMEKLLA